MCCSLYSKYFSIEHLTDTNSVVCDPPAREGVIPTDPPLIVEACSGALLAPQAELIGAIIQGVFGGSINLPMVTLGFIIAGLLIWKKLPVMSVAIGIYLPLQLSSSIMIGGIIAAFMLGTARLRQMEI